LVQDPGDAREARRDERRIDRIAAKADYGVRTDPLQPAPHHDDAAEDPHAGHPEADRVADRRRRPRYDMHRFGRKTAAIAADPVVGDQVNGVAAPAQFLRQRHGGEQMSARAPGHECEGAHSAGDITMFRYAGSPVARRSWGSLRVSASISPIPSATASIEVPP